MDLKIDIDAEQIQQQVTEAILNSSLGVTISKAIESALSNYETKRIWEAAIKDEVRRVVVLEARKAVEHNRSAIQEIVRKEIDDKAIQDIAARMIDWLYREDTK